MIAPVVPKEMISKDDRDNMDKLRKRGRDDGRKWQQNIDLIEPFVDFKVSTDASHQPATYYAATSLL